MQKKFLSNLALILVLNLLIKPFAIFGIDATIQNRIGAQEYGLYFSLLNLSFLFNIVMDLGINNYTTKNIAQFPHIAGNYMGKIFSFRLLLFFLYAALTFILALLIGYRGSQIYLLFLLVFNQLLVTIIAYFRSHFGGLHLFKTDALISVLDRFLLILICGGALLFSDAKNQFQVEWYIYIQTICYSLTLVIACILLFQKIGLPKFKFNPVFSLAILKKSYPYAFLIVLMMLYTRTDSIMLERIHENGAYEAGIYAQGFRLLDALFMFGMIFANLLLPIFSKLLLENNSLIPNMLKTARDLLLGGAILGAILCTFHSEFILGLIYTNDVSASVPSFQFLMWSFIGMCITLIYGTLLTANGNLRFLNQISLLGVIVNVVFNAFLIPTFGAAGAAFATLVTQSMIALLQMIYCHVKFSIPFSRFNSLNYVFFIALLLAIPFLIENQNMQFILQLVAGIVGLFLFKFIDLKQLKETFQGKLAENEINGMN